MFVALRMIFLEKVFYWIPAFAGMTMWKYAMTVVTLPRHSRESGNPVN